MSIDGSGEGDNNVESLGIKGVRILVGDDDPILLSQVGMIIEFEVEATLLPEDRVCFPRTDETADEMIRKMNEAQAQGNPYGFVMTDGLSNSNADFNDPDENLIHSLRVIKAAAQNGVKQVIIFSSHDEFAFLVPSLRALYPNMGIQFIKKGTDVDDIVAVLNALEF